MKYLLIKFSAFMKSMIKSGFHVINKIFGFKIVNDKTAHPWSGLVSYRPFFFHQKMKSART